MAPSELLGIYRKFGNYPVSRHGAQALWGRETMAGMADGGPAAGGRLEAELGYGMPVGGHLVGMPSFGIGASGHGRDYRLGYGLTVAQGGAMHFELGIDANRREKPLSGNCGAWRFRPAHRALVEVAPGSCRPRLSRAARRYRPCRWRERRILRNRRHERPDSPGLASGKIFRNPLPSDADRRLKWNGGQQAYLRHLPSSRRP